MSDPKFGTFEDLLDIAPDALRSIMTCLRELILLVDPDAVMVVRLGDKAATFGVGPKKMSEGYCYILPYSKWVNLGFYHGVALPDPDGLLQGTGAKMRHIKIRSIEDCQNPMLSQMIGNALKERKAALGLS